MSVHHNMGITSACLAVQFTYLPVGSFYSCMCFQIAMSEHLKTLEVYNISTIPKLQLPLNVLFAASFDVQDAENLFQHLRTLLRKSSSHPAAAIQAKTLHDCCCYHRNSETPDRQDQAFTDCSQAHNISAAAVQAVKTYVIAMSAVTCHAWYQDQVLGSTARFLMVDGIIKWCLSQLKSGLC